MPAAPVPPSEADTLRANLEQPLDRLRFSPSLEAPFLTHLRNAQRRSALFTLCAVLLIWLGYAVLDVWRWNSLSRGADADMFFWAAMVPRWLVLVCLGCGLWVTVQPRVTLATYTRCIAGVVLACSVAVISSSYALKNLGLPETSVVIVILVSVAFFPLGVRLRVMAPVALLVCALIVAAGPVLLHHPDDLLPHWVLSAVSGCTWVLSGVTAYYSEHGWREQFVLRRLLNWEASHDPLTHLPNRRMFHQHLDTCMRQAQREQVPLFLVLFDIDHFKLYNDCYGHQAGDAVLQQFAELLCSYARRPLDLPVRLGGEEFGLVMYDISPQGLQAHLAQLQAQLHALQLPHAASPTAAWVTVSMGAALVTALDTQDSAFQRADGLLYQAKHQGRNRLCLQALDVPVPTPAHCA